MFSTKSIFTCLFLAMSFLQLSSALTPINNQFVDHGLCRKGATFCPSDQSKYIYRCNHGKFRRHKCKTGNYCVGSRGNASCRLRVF
ncbi:hypothetical protein AYI68_g7795 [Smittium mucronatum]|uniref:Chitin-binding type-2 domain-containing protein n=1 Tax=Smittium mucronatum TaxID=133383 RepID=A0A1R0GMN7_9FUNG|nr:hypothetical protein AYI68_g7795 [Smittium mucronatum]